MQELKKKREININSDYVNVFTFFFAKSLHPRYKSPRESPKIQRQHPRGWGRKSTRSIIYLPLERRYPTQPAPNNTPQRLIQWYPENRSRGRGNPSRMTCTKETIMTDSFLPSSTAYPKRNKGSLSSKSKNRWTKTHRMQPPRENRRFVSQGYRMLWKRKS